VLDRHDVDAGRQRAGRVDVIGPLVATDPVMDLDRVRGARLRVEERDDLAAARGGGQVVGEGRDAAATRRVGGNESSPNDGVSPLEPTGAGCPERRTGLALASRAAVADRVEPMPDDRS